MNITGNYTVRNLVNSEFILDPHGSYYYISKNLSGYSFISSSAPGGYSIIGFDASKSWTGEIFTITIVNKK